MTPQTPNLAQLQREMAAAIMTPLSPDEQMRTETSDGRSLAEIAASFIAPNSRLTAFERLELYNRQYWYRVLGGLTEDFPALRAVVGPRAFDALLVAYLTAHPSRSFTLRNLGSRMADWLTSHPQYVGRRHRMAVDVARMEWAFVEAFDSGERDPLTLDQISTLDGDSRLALQPHLRLIELDYPVDDLVLALHKAEKRQATEAGVEHEGSANDTSGRDGLPVLRRQPTWLAAHRVDLSVYYIRIKHEEFKTLIAIRQGKPISQAIEEGITSSRAPSARRPQLVHAWFAKWAELGWICAPELEAPRA